MPPKRKAPTSTAENEPAQTRRRTRAAAAAEDGAEPAVADLPPAKRTRRPRAGAEDGPPAQDTLEKVENGASAGDGASRATRARGRKAVVPAAQDVDEPGPSVPLKRGRPKKTQPVVAEVEEEDVLPEELAANIPKMLSSGEGKPSQDAPKKRGRAKKTQETDQPVTENPRLKRTRRAKPSVEDDVVQDMADPLATSSSATEVELPVHPVPTTPKKRGRRQVAAPAKANPPQKASPVKAQASSSRQEDGEVSDDELLLRSPTRQVVRPSTPIRNNAANGVGTPRMFMHSVEIITPKRMLNTLRRDHVSPGPRAIETVHIPPLGTPRLPAAFTSVVSSNKRSLAVPRPSSSKHRATRTPSPRPSAVRLSSLHPPETPSRTPRRSVRQEVSQSSDTLPHVLPANLHPLLERQKRVILKSLQHPPELDEIDIYGEDYPPTNTLAYEQLGDLLAGTVVRGEGNSCLLIGPRGSGKSQMVERAIAALPSNPIVVRLSGYAQHNDRLAIREIAWQLAQQTGRSFLPSEPEDAEDEDEPIADGPPPEPPERDPDEDDNPFVEPVPAPAPDGATAVVVALPPPAHLLALISMIPTLPRPTVIVLDGFDLFAGHARQALLYCLLDTAQACRTGTGAGSGMAVVGVTARVDTINLLEKRVKSRFSGRMIRTACPAKMEHWVSLAQAALGASVVEDGVRPDESEKEWEGVWGRAVEKFVKDEAVLETLRETYALTRDLQMFRRIFTCLTLELKPTSPYPTLAKLDLAVSRQRCPSRYPPLHTLPYPAICLLIASVHAQTTGHDAFTFEMLYDGFRSQVRTSQSAPVQVEGGSIGMMRCSREVLLSAFERLADLRIFLPAGAPAASVLKEFALHRSAVDRFAVKKAVERIGQMNLKKWFAKG